MEAGVKRRRLAGACRPGHEENSIRQLHQAFERFLVVGKKTKLRQTELQTGFIEQTHNDTLAVIGGNGGDA